MGYELVRVAVLGRERPTVQVMADRADGSQITVQDCENISHTLSAVLDVDDPIPGADDTSAGALAAIVAAELTLLTRRRPGHAP